MKDNRSSCFLSELSYFAFSPFFSSFSRPISDDATTLNPLVYRESLRFGSADADVAADDHLVALGRPARLCTHPFLQRNRRLVIKSRGFSNRAPFSPPRHLPLKKGYSTFVQKNCISHTLKVEFKLCHKKLLKSGISGNA